MSAAEGSTIPYERQEDLQTNRMCGAASLSMVYRSFGKHIPQAEIWPRISKHNRFGSLASTTYLMAQDALSRGFSTLAIQAKHPLQVLRLCRENGTRAVLNHRLKADSEAGHYTVLVDMDADSVVLHDPFLGPSRRLAHGELLELWLPRHANTEITGNVLIAVAAHPATVAPCKLCGTVIPPRAACPGCGKPVSLQPASILGCTGDSCPARMWNTICCPFCNTTWNLNSERQESQAASGSAPSAAAWGLDLGALYYELDKFCNHILSFPAAAANPDIRQQLDFINASKDRLSLAQSEELARRKIDRAEAEQREQTFKQDEEALLKKREEINKPSPPADGNALGQSLLKDLGLT
jgi:Papain-like cysteine protease AvrRpt2